ncbi:MAG: MFS transporter [Solirubrobacterales bacterium]
MAAPISARRVTIAATGLLLAAALPQYMVGAVAVSVRDDFPFTDAQLGLAVGLSFGIAAVVTPSAGRLIERIGVLSGVRISVAVIATSTLAIATVVDTAAALIVCMALVGLGGGLGSPGYSALLAAGVPPERQGTAFGVLTSAPQIAIFLSGLALPLIADPFGWRAAFVIPVAVSLASLYALPSARQLAKRARVDSRGVVSLRRMGPVHVIALSAALASAAGIGMRSFLVVFAVAVGISSGDAGLLLATSGAVALASRLGFGVLGDRRPGDPLRTAGALMIVSAVGFGLMAIGANAAIVAGTLLAGGLGWGWAAPMGHAVIQRYPDAPAAAMGTQISGFFVGAVIGPLLVGILVGSGGFTEAWLLCTAFALFAALAAFAATRMTRPDAPAASPLSQA